MKQLHTFSLVNRMNSDKAQPSKDVLVRALRELKELKEKLTAVQRAQNEPIAVIGLACRFPGDADTPDDYWRLLRQGVNAISETPPSRWDVDKLYDPDPEAVGKMMTKMGGFLRDVASFDPAFFGIAPREVPNMDPQHRLALEVSWEALEQAGLTADQLLDSETGVFMGISTSDYAHLMLTQTSLEEINAYSLTGNSANVSAGRIAYALGLQGPTAAVDTACSSSLVAVHLACQSLRSQECDAALAGGVSLILSPINSIAFSRMKAMAPDGLCKTFDAKANGYARGEGCGVIVLKRLSDAVAAGDNVLALIRGSAVNQDGRSGGLTVPNGPAQQAVIRRALRQAGVTPNLVSYVEAHGTGTSLGDPIELESLGAVYGEGRDSGAPLLVGSVKTNFGHLEAAAGIAGLIKIILSLQHGAIPAHLHFQEPTPRVDWSRLPLRVPTTLTDWQPVNGRFLAGVSSFGFSGTNAHVILEAGEPAAREPVAPHLPTATLFTLSAKSEPQLKAMAARLADFLAQEDGPSLTAVTYTSQVRRSHWHWRLAALVSSPDELRQKLAAYAAGEAVDDFVIGESRPHQPPNVSFFFSGQGGQRVGMGADLYRDQPAFRRAFDTCAEAAAPYLLRPLTDLCFQEGQSGAPFADQVTAQVCLFALQISLSRLWQAWGVEPAIVLGQSMGEFAAAVTAGVFDLETAMGLVAERARLMVAQPVEGAMGVLLSTPEKAAEILARYPEQVWLAGQNTPQEVLIGGRAPAVAQLLAECAAEGIKTRSLRAFTHAGVAGHTPLMQPVVEALAPRLTAAKRQRPFLNYISSYTGTLADEELRTVDYWLNQSRRPFNLDTAVNSWLEQGSTLAVEIGPTSGTLGVARRCAPDAAVQWLPSMREQADENRQMLTTLAALYVNGVNLNWPALHGEQRYPPVALPFTPFQRERYWLPEKMGRRPVLSNAEGLTQINADFFTAAGSSRSAAARLLGEQIPSPLAAAQFTAVWHARSLDFLGDHLVHEAVVMAGAAHLLRTLTAAQALYGDGPLEIKEALFARPLILADDEARHVQLVLQPDSSSAAHFQISSLTADAPGQAGWVEHVVGQVGRAQTTAKPLVTAAPLETLQVRCAEPLAAHAFYEGLRQRSYCLGPSFRWLEAIWRGDGEALAQVRIPQAEDGDYLIPPGLLDACLQLLSAAGPSEGLPTYVPYSVDSLRFYGRSPHAPLWCYAAVRKDRLNGQTIVGDLCLFDEAGNRVIELAGLHARPITSEDLRRELRTATAPAEDTPFFEVRWLPQPIAAPTQAANGRWLILADDLGVGSALAQKLPNCLLVRPGDSYQQIGAGAWQVRPQAAADYERLLADAAAVGGTISGILHLWSLNNRSEQSADDWLAGRIWGCDSALLLLQAMARQTAVNSHLYCVTAASQPVGDPDPAAPAPHQAALWGLGAVAANEQPDLWGGLIDLPWDSPAAMATILHRTLQANDGENRVAWRTGERYVARLASLRAGEPVMAKNYSPHATYLLTGGLGALGLHLADWLAARGARHLVLLGRHAPDAAAQARIEALQQQGVTVVVGQVDVTDLVALTAVFSNIQTTMPPLRAVFHLAGILADSTLLQESPEHLHRVMAPKIQGAWNLHRLTETADLDHFVLFSSAAAVLGGPGQAAYAAANAALDGLAHYRRARGLTAVTLNWGPWRDGGLAESSGTDQQRWQAWGIESIDPAEGLRYLDLALARPEAQIVIMSWNLTAVAEQAATLSTFFHDLAPVDVPALADNTAVNQWRERISQAAPNQRRAILVQQLQEQARRTLRLSANVVLADDRPLHELGLDSLMAVELRNALAQLTGAALPVTLLFDYPSIDEMADYLLVELFDFAAETDTAVGDDVPADKLAAEIEALSEEEALARLIQSLAQVKGI